MADRNKLPLGMYPAFHAASLEALAAHLRTYLAAPVLLLPEGGGPVDARSNRVSLGQSELWYCAYGVPLSVDVPDTDYLRFQVGYRGSGATRMGDNLVAITPDQACISRGAIRIDFAADFEKAVWRIPRPTLSQKLTLMTGRPLKRPPEFEAALDLTRPEGTGLARMLACLIEAADVIEGAAAAIVLAEMEQAFIAMFLATTQHDARHLIDQPATPAAPWQVRRAEAYIEANWHRPLMIEDLVAVTGVSARTLFRTFRLHRGYSPLQFARSIRLEKARQLLENPGALATSVTEVALATGFGDVGRFSTTFVRAFGIRPSALLARARNAAGGTSAAHQPE